MIFNCDEIWTKAVTLIYRVRKLPRVTNEAPPRDRFIDSAVSRRDHASAPTTGKGS